MTKSRTPQYSFSSGEISPLLWSRPDYQRNQTGVRKMNGYIPLRQGGFTRAPGTIFRGSTRNNAKARLIDFEFAENDALTLEFTALRMRVWRYGSLIESEGSPFELVTPYDEADLDNLQWVQSADVIYICDGTQPIQKLSRFALDDWTIAPLQLDAGPFRIQNLDEEKTIQCSGVYGALKIWSADESLTVGDLRKRGQRVYEFKGRDFGRTNGSCGPTPPTHETGEEGYTWIAGVDEEHTAYWLYLYTTPATGTIDLSSNVGIFTSDHVGTLFRLQPTDLKDIALWTGNTPISVGEKMRYADNIYELTGGNNTGVNPPIHLQGEQLLNKEQGTRWRFVSDLVGVVRIKTVESGTAATADVLSEIPSPVIDQPTYRWSEGAWSEIYGYPKSIEIFDQSLFAAFTRTDPRGVWASTLGDFQDFEPSVEADGSFAYTISGSDSQNSGTWLRRARRGIFIGALGEVIRGFSNASGQRIGPTTFDTSVEATDGSRPIRPINPYGYPVFVTKDGTRIEEIRFSFEEDGGKPVELSLPSQHLGAPGFEELAWQSAPQRLAWIRRGNGDLVVMLYDPDEQVLGWARCSVAGGFVEALSVSTSADSKNDILTMVVRRVIDGETVRMIEEQAVVFGIIAGEQPISDAIHFFAASRFQPETATDTFSVPHLVGQTVYAWTDLGQYGPYVVPASGNVTLEVPVSTAAIGLFDETHEGELLDIPAPARDGSSIGRKKRLHAGSGIVLLKTAAGKVQSVERNFKQPARYSLAQDLIPKQIASDIVEAYDGTRKLDMSSGYADEVSLRFTPDGGAPMTIGAIIPNIEEANA
jgi:hypothetical protein